MLSDLRSSAAAIAAFTLLLGVAYPLAITGVAQPLFGERADGDARLIAQKPSGRPGEFLPRPSQTDYSATATDFSNLGPNGVDTAKAFRANIDAYARREGVPAARVPNDAAQNSASGIDPDISPANALLQAPRVARERGLSLERVTPAVEEVRKGRLLGVVGEETVNVGDLNAVLEATR